jgi:hypothetical protein
MAELRCRFHKHYDLSYSVYSLVSNQIAKMFDSNFSRLANVLSRGRLEKCAAR